MAQTNGTGSHRLLSESGLTIPLEDRTDDRPKRLGKRISEHITVMHVILAAALALLAGGWAGHVFVGGFARVEQVAALRGEAEALRDRVTVVEQQSEYTAGTVYLLAERLGVVVAPPPASRRTP